jgi:hypothetical protein
MLCSKSQCLFAFPPSEHSLPYVHGSCHHFKTRISQILGILEFLILTESFSSWNLRGNKQVSEDGQKVRRLVPIPPEDEVLDRTIYAKPFKFNSVGKVGSAPDKFRNSKRCRKW